MEHRRVLEYGSEFDWDANRMYLKEDAQAPLIQDAVLVRSGRDALAAIALKHRDEYRRVLLPALCCISMVTPFSRNGYEPVFYTLHNSLMPDLKDIRAKICGKALLVYMNYFGAPSLKPEDMERIREEGDVILVQDRTHDLLATREEKPVSDYTVASIRKWAALADGGLLHAGCGIMNEPSPDRTSLFARLRSSALEHKRIYLSTGDAGMKERFRDEFERANELLEDADACCAMSPETRELLPHIDFAAVYNKRRLNVLALSELVADIPGVLEAVKCPERSALYYPIHVKNRNRLQSILAEQGVYCPVIWPIPAPAIGVCKTARTVAEHMLAIPCDQRYGPEDMEYIACTLRRSMNELAG